MAEKRFDKELKTLEKRANQRLVRLEKAGLMNTAAYKNVQAKLEMMGVHQKKAAGRRFSESGTEEYNRAEQLKKILKSFLDSKTSTVKGYKEVRRKAWKTANEKFDLKKHGVSEEDYMSFWSSYPDDEKDRMFGSDIVIEIINTYYDKNGEEAAENTLTGAEIAERINKAKDYKSALKSVGLSFDDIDAYDRASDLGEMNEGFYVVDESPFDTEPVSKRTGAKRSGKTGTKRPAKSGKNKKRNGTNNRRKRK